MSKLNRFFAYIINLVPAVLLCYSIINALILPIGINIYAYKIVAIIALLIVLYSIVFFSKKTIVLSCFILLITFLSYTFYIYYNNYLLNLIKKISNFFNWIYCYLIKVEPINDKYVKICCIISLIVITFIIYLFAVKKFNFYVLFIGGISIFVIHWIFDYFYSFPTFYLFVFLLIYYYIRHIYIKSPFNENEDSFANSAIFIWAAPLCALILCSSLYLPEKDKPIEWAWLDKKINWLYSSATGGNYITFDEFSISKIGFGQDNGVLGGKVKEDNIHVLDVESPRSLYLRGTIKNQYTGVSWENTTNKSLRESLYSNYDISLDYNQSLKAYKFLQNYNVSNYISNPSRRSMSPILRDLKIEDKGKYEDYLSKCFYTDKVRVTYRNIKSKVLFVPLKTYWIDVLTLNPFNYKTNFTGDIISNESYTNGFTYYMDTYTVKADSEDLKTLLRKSKPNFFQDNLINYMKANPDLKDCLNMSNPSKPEIDLYKLNNSYAVNDEEFKSLLKNKEYTDLIYKVYTKLPADTLPPRINDLVSDITKNYNNSYDKVKAIEIYLSRNPDYLYTLTPEEIPKGRDFVDYFLFESKEGYCTYYATAMAVMVRSLGIPSRYVEGFALPSKPIIDTTTYKVTSMNAHAWVEVYFEGFGWVSFEPTSAFTSEFYNTDFRKQNNSYTPYGTTPSISAEPNKLNDNTNNSEENTNKISKLTFILVLVLAVIFAIILLAAFNIIKRKLILRKYFKYEARKSILALFKFYLKVLSLNSFKIRPGETPIMFAQRIDGAFYFTEIKFNQISDIFLSARYSINEISVYDKTKVFNFYKDLDMLSKKELGNLKYILYKYILGLI